MAFIVEMARGEPFRPGFASYSCGYSAWKGLLSIAKSFGWIPLGTVRNPRSASKTKDYEKHFEPNYNPEEWAHCKRISDSDALNLVVALKRAADSISNENVLVFERPGSILLRDDMTPEEFRRVNQLPTELLKQFIQFAGGGGFAFAWDD